VKSVFLDGTIQYKDIPKPIPRKDQVLVRINYAGICNTDLELVKGYMGFTGVLGHEFTGVVVESSDKKWIGKRICGEINFGCGECSYCRSGLSRHCPERTVLGILDQNGAFAEYTTIPLQNLVHVPDRVDDLSAVFVEPLAAALEISEQVHIEPAMQVAVIGDGKLGLLICQTLNLTACQLMLVGKHERNLAIANEWGVSTRKPEQAGSNCFDIVIEASGSPTGFAMAMDLLRPRGIMVLKSTYHGDLTMNAAQVVVDEITIIGSRCGLFKPAVQLLAKGLVDVKSMIDKVYPMSEAKAAFDKAAERGTLKVVLKIDE
jgi:threonine dehydrogenase-like Zn-dependent dehydrogenase